MRALLCCVVTVLAISAPTARAADPEWSAGVASVKITPEKPVPLAGYAARTKPFEKVDLDICAKAVALQDAGGRRAILVTADLCTIPTDVAEPVRSRIAEKHRLEPAAVILNLSHTHSGPSVSLRPRSEGPTAQPNPADAAGTVEYTKWLQDRLAAVADDAFARLQPASIASGSGVAHFAMNRREFTDRGVILGVNPRGLVDRSVPVLRINGPDGTAKAIVFGYACHGTTNPSNHLGVSPDYPGFARNVIERHFPGAESLFVAGCGGDANPYPRLDLKDAPANGEALGNEVVRVAGGGKLTPVHGPLSCALVTAQLPLETPDRAALQSIARTSGQRKSDAQQMLAALDRGESLPATHPAPVVAWQFGKDLTLVALPNEVVVEYVPLIERAVGPLRLWVAGYCNEVVGYIPSRQVLSEGGYETRGLYTGSGWFTPGVEDALVRAAQEAAANAGRPAGTKSP